MKFEEMLFLKESYAETLENYNLVLNKEKRFGWDWIIVTASNINQAESYRTQIKYRLEQGIIPDVRIDVIPDYDNKRIGSGGATLNVLKFISENDSEWKNKKILLIHSGGDSKRIPQYSACGKLFSYVPRSLIDNKPSTLFDEFMVTLSLVPEKLKEGILIVSGDVLLLFNYLQIDLNNDNAFAVSIKSPVEIGKNHGVFLTDDNYCMNKFLHKCSVEDLKNHGAVDKNGMVDIDTGIVWMDNNIATDLLDLLKTNNKLDNDKFEQYINDVNRLNFYGDIIYPLSNFGTIEEYISLPSENIYDENLKQCRYNIWDKLKKYKLKVIKTSPSKFIHVGTTNELRYLNSNAEKDYNFLDWKNSILTNRNIENVSIINSLIDDESIIGKGSFIENSIINQSRVGKDSVISGVKLKNNVPDNTVLNLLPIIIDNHKYYVLRIYGNMDNPKEENILFSKKINEVLKFYNSTDEFLYKDNKRTLWDANLYEICETEEKTQEFLNLFLKIFDCEATQEEFEKWKRSKRISLSNSFIKSDMDGIVNRQSNLDIKIRANVIVEEFNKKASLEDCLKYITKKNVLKIVNEINKFRTEKNYKLDILISHIMKKYSDIFPNKSLELENQAYEKIKNSLEYNKYEYKINRPKETIEVNKPVRINFGGGWSDTPPYCIENGAAVLNAAIYLNDKFPIKVTVSKNNKNVYEFESVDLKSSVKYTTKDALKQFKVVGDPFILSKAVLCALGVVESDYLDEYGIKIVTEVHVPAGSGLGTSSILTGTIIEAVAKFYGVDLNEKQVFDLVLQVEQMVSTGGGWQDQIGGLTPGIKLITTEPGNNQKYQIDYLSFNKNVEELEERMVLVYTGQRRIAKNLLRKIMNQYITNDKKSVNVLSEIRKIAAEMKEELETGNVDNFGNMLYNHFNLVMKMDAGITNVCINHIIKTCEDMISGVTIAGAGGGGFLFMILKKGIDKKQLEDKLYDIYKDNGVKVYDCKFVKDFNVNKVDI